MKICDNIHSIYVDQWDWEKVITAKDRNEEYLKARFAIFMPQYCETAREVKKNIP